MFPTTLLMVVATATRARVIGRLFVSHVLTTTEAIATVKTTLKIIIGKMRAEDPLEEVTMFFLIATASLSTIRVAGAEHQVEDVDAAL